MRLLLIEDSEFDHYRLTKRLRHLDVEVLWAETSERAVELLQKGEFDAVLADQILDGEDHLPLLRACKKPVIQYSGLAVEPDTYSKVNLDRVVQRIEELCNAPRRKT